MSKPALSPAVAQALREVAEALKDTPTGPASGIAKPLVRAFVWETYRDGDAVEAMRAIWFGAVSRDGSGETECAQRWAQLLTARAAERGVTIPREARR